MVRSLPSLGPSPLTTLTLLPPSHCFTLLSMRLRSRAFALSDQPAMALEGRSRKMSRTKHSKADLDDAHPWHYHSQYGPGSRYPPPFAQNRNPLPDRISPEKASEFSIRRRLCQRWARDSAYPGSHSCLSGGGLKYAPLGRGCQAGSIVKNGAY